MTRTACLALLAAATATLPAHAAPKAYTVSLDGAIHRIAPGGQPELVTTLDGTLTAVTAHADHLIVGDALGRVSRVDPASGAVLAEYQVWHGIGVAALSTTPAGDIFAADAQSNIVYLDPAGNEVDTYYSGVQVSAMLVDGDRLVIGSPNTLIFSAPFGATFGDPDFQFISACGGIVNSLVLTEAHLFAGDANGTVYRFGADGGEYQTTFATATDAKGVAALSGELLVLGSDGTLERRDPATGALLSGWSIGAPGSALTTADFACIADLEADDHLNIDDIDAFIAAFTAELPAADLDQSGTHTLDDVDLFIGAFSNGCP